MTDQLRTPAAELALEAALRALRRKVEKDGRIDPDGIGASQVFACSFLDGKPRQLTLIVEVEGDDEGRPPVPETLDIVDAGGGP